MKKFFIFICCIPLVFVNLSSAHQPRVVGGGEEVLEIKNPDISQAFYGELKGVPAHYKITSNEPFSLYLSVLVPDIEGIDKNISVELYKMVAEREIPDKTLLDGESFEWTSFYEPFAGDDYFQGPDWGPEEVEVGEYHINVFNPDNNGRYSLVVGQKEEFPLAEIWNTVLALPSLKKNFFNKSPFSAFFNLTGVFLLIALVLIIIVILLLRKFIRKMLLDTRLF